MSEQSAEERHRRFPASARALSLTGVALLAIGVTTYFAVPAWSGTSAGPIAAWIPPAGTRIPVTAASPSGQPTIPGPMPGAPTQTPTPSPPPTGGPQVITHATPTAIQPSNPALVSTWNSGPAGSALATVTELSSSALMAEAMGQYADMLQDCNALDAAIGSAKRAALIPDAAMQAEYAVALGSFDQAAESCGAGIRQLPEGVEDTVTEVNQTVMNNVGSRLSNGAFDLFDATGLLRRR